MTVSILLDSGYIPAVICADRAASTSTIVVHGALPFNVVIALFMASHGVAVLPTCVVSMGHRYLALGAEPDTIAWPDTVHVCPAGGPFSMFRYGR